MLGTLTIENCYAHKNASFDFSTGLTAITGPNFSGKSQILEMVRFALFGVAALRTKAEDYKGAKVALSFRVKGLAYRVERSTTSAKLFREDDLLATGVKPVNLKIVDLFGYGLEVFDTANVASQGMIEALGAMRPAERKRLVDSTIGLNVLDDLAKWCQDEGTSKGKELAAITAVAKVPEQPIKPSGYKPLTEIQAERARLSGLQTELLSIQRLITVEPTIPEVPACSEERTLDTLEAISRRRKTLDGQIAMMRGELRGLGAEPALSLEEIQAMETLWDNHEARAKADIWMKTHPDASSYTHMDVQRWEEELHTHDRWREWTKLNAEGHHECPECHHRWPFKAGVMAELGDWKDKPAPPKPTISSLLVLSQMRQQLVHYEATLEERAVHRLVQAAHPHPINLPKLKRGDLQKLRTAHDATAQRASLITEIACLEMEAAGVPDVSGAITARRAYEMALSAFQAAQARRLEWEGQMPGWQARVAELQGVPELLEAAITLQVAVQTYDQMQAAYLVDMAAHAKVLARMAALNQEIDQFARAKAALIEIKGKVKGYLVPSLSRVASMIINKMTGGALTSVFVDESFDITVMGKPIDGLSGCGKAAANLALRIGLGQVLTNRVFSVFMADEIDASMDDDNARYTADCLHNLVGSISQIILVSHKTPAADNYIRL